MNLQTDQFKFKTDNRWKWFGQQLIICQQLTQFWLDQVFTTLAPGQPWKQNHIEFSYDLLYQNTVLVLTQSLLYKDCTASALRVWSVCLFLRVWSWLFLVSITDVWYLPVSENNHMGDTQEISLLSWVSWLSPTSSGQGIVEYLYPGSVSRISLWDKYDCSEIRQRLLLAGGLSFSWFAIDNWYLSLII
jgi:hypothetical protein